MWARSNEAMRIPLAKPDLPPPISVAEVSALRVWHMGSFLN